LLVLGTNPSELNATPPGAANPAGPLAGVAGLHLNDITRIRSFWRSVERYPPGAMIHVTRKSSRKQFVVVSGWGCETRILPDGRRQIFSFLLPGDVVDLTRTSNIGRRSFMSLTRLEIVDAEVVIAAEPGDGQSVREALQKAATRTEERLFDHLVRIGRLTAKERVLNLLLELHDRLLAVGLVKDDTFRLPLTQEVFADALGLSIVHINRTLQQLRRTGRITLKGGSVTLHDRAKLSAYACYESQNHQKRSFAPTAVA
jgi:CRP-like cAMP-binding protein